MRVRSILCTILLSLSPSMVFGQAPLDHTQANCKFMSFSASSVDTLLSVNGISPSNIVVGSLEDNSTLHNSGFVRSSNGQFTTYDAPNSSSTNFTGRNGAGVNTGIYQDNATGGYHGFTLQGSVSSRQLSGSDQHVSVWHQ